MKKALISIVCIIVIILSCTHLYSNTKNPPKKKLNITSFEIELVNTINTYRKSIGINELKPINFISLVSSKHNDYMIHKGEIDHFNFEQRAKYVTNNINTNYVGENLARGYSNSNAIVKAWLKSKQHKKVLEFSDFLYIGISIKTDSQDRAYITAMFAGNI